MDKEPLEKEKERNM